MFIYLVFQDFFYPFDYENPTYNGTGLQDFYEDSAVEDSEVEKLLNLCWLFRFATFSYPILSRSLALRTTPCFPCRPSST